MILGEVEKIEFHPRVGERHTLAVRTYDATPFGQSTRRERLGNAGLRDVVVLHDVKKRFQARLHASVGGMGVDFEDQIGFGSELRCEHGMSECVDRTTEVAHAEKEKGGVLLGEGHGVQDLIVEMPNGRSCSHWRK